MNKIAWTVGIAAFAMLVATPASALDVGVQKRLVDDQRQPSGCVVGVEKITPDFGSQSRYLDVRGWLDCDTRWGVKFVKARAYGGGPRHEWLRTDLTPSPGKERFRLHVRCNNKMDGTTWNHPEQPITVRFGAKVGRGGDTYDAAMRIATQITC